MFEHSPSKETKIPPPQEESEPRRNSNVVVVMRTTVKIVTIIAPFGTQCGHDLWPYLGWSIGGARRWILFGRWRPRDNVDRENCLPTSCALPKGSFYKS